MRCTTGFGEAAAVLGLSSRVLWSLSTAFADTPTPLGNLSLSPVFPGSLALRRKLA